MDFEAQRKKRMEDLAQKRKRLEEMRKQRAEKSRVTESASSIVTQDKVSTPPPPPPDDTSVDDLVKSLLADGDPPSTTDNTKSEEKKVNDAPETPPALSRLEIIRQRSTEWSTCQNVCTFTILPVVSEVYEKGTQTEGTSDQEVNDVETSSESQETFAYHRSPQRPRQRSRGDSTIEEESPSKPKTSTSAAPAVTCSADEVNKIVASSSFRSFLSYSTHIVERALGLSNSIDLLRDLTGQQLDNSAASGSSSDVLKRSRIYQNGNVATRPVMDIQTSPHHAELFATSYGSPTAMSSDSNHSGGMVCLWSLLLPQEPEFVFTASSPVLVLRFHPENVHLVIGACYSGQVLLWDTRNTSSSRAVQRSSSSGKGHKHPVYSMCLARRAASSTSTSSDWILITASTDGLLCHWDLENLNEPLSYTVINSCIIIPSIGLASFKSTIIEGNPKQAMVGTQGSERPISVSCMALGPEEEDRKLIVGSECGAIFCFSLPFNANKPFSKSAAHFGMITSLNVNPSTLPNFKYLLLTSSVDWTVKLWHIMELSQSLASEAVQPLLTFPVSSFQYVTSVHWSPLHPGVFSTTASGGNLIIWNLCHSVVEPVGEFNVQHDQSPESKPKSNTLSKAVWLDDGRKLLVGEASGATHCIAIRSSTAATLRTGDEERLESAISKHPNKLASTSRRRASIGASEDLAAEGSNEEKQTVE